MQKDFRHKDDHLKRDLDSEVFLMADSWTILMVIIGFFLLVPIMITLINRNSPE